MAKIPQLFEIENYDVRNNHIEVFTVKHMTCIPVRIPLDTYTAFLLRTDKRQFELNYSDHQGEHVQRCGTMTMEEYWNQNDSYIKSDLYEYITTHPINFRGEVRENAAESLME